MRFSYTEALERAMNTCSRSEKAVSDIEESLKKWGVESNTDRRKIIETLIEDKFIDELRFSKAYTRDKHLFNKWGRIKIKTMLRAKRINDSIIDDALDTLDEEKYKACLMSELIKKKKSVKATNIFELKGKLMRFAAGKGYEADLIYKAMDKLLEEKFD